MLTVFCFCCGINIDLGQSSEPRRVLADIMQMQVRMANCWNDSDLRLPGTGHGMLEDSLKGMELNALDT